MKEIEFKIDKIIKSGVSKKKLGVCDNYPNCYNQRVKGCKFCDQCFIDYHNEHKDDV